MSTTRQFNMRNPGMIFRVTWLDRANRGRALGGRGADDGTADAADAAANRSQALFNTASLVVAIVGSAAGLLALFVGR